MDKENYLVFTHTPICVSTETQYFPEFSEKKSQLSYSDEIRTQDLCQSSAEVKTKPYLCLPLLVCLSLYNKLNSWNLYQFASIS